MSEERWREFGLWLKSEREKAGVQQNDAAKEADIHVVQLSRIENGHSGAKRETVIQIVNAINKLSKDYKIDIAEALNKAGFALQNSELVPEEISVLGFDDLDSEAIEDIAEFIKFKKSQVKNGR